VHGNKSDKKLRVYINLELNRDGFLVIQIGDEGQGFDYENVADPTTTENREKTSGRGIYIIRKLADRCLFNSIGNQIELHFKI
jgi:serine/threonine-protein kinase RsbW